MSEIMVNFIAFDDTRNACQMVLVEGPWAGSTEAHLHALQDRIYGCLDAALDGQLAAQFPEAMGKTVVVRIDAYNLPRGELEAFVDRFAAGVAQLPGYSPDNSPYVTDIEFELNHCSLPEH